MLKSYKNILLIIIAVFVVFAAGIVLMPKKEQVVRQVENEKQEQVQVQDETGDEMMKEETTTEEAQTINTEPEIITSDVDTSNWEIYRNEEYGFEVKYPSEWKNEVFKKGEPKRDPIPNSLTIFIYDLEGDMKFFILVDKGEDGNDYEEYIDNYTYTFNWNGSLLNKNDDVFNSVLSTFKILNKK